MQKPFFSVFFPSFCAHISGVEFLYLDLKWKEKCGKIAILAAESGGNEGQLPYADPL